MKKIVLIILSVLLALALYLINNERIMGYLSKTSRQEANLLVVESWMPDYAIDEALKEFQSGNYDLIITTGLITPDVEYFNMYSNGYLIFYPESILPPDSIKKRHLIEVTAHSKMGGRYMAHFNLHVNDSLKAEFMANDKIQKFAIDWVGSLDEIDSILVHFDNDYVDEKGDINLYVKEITIDNKYVIPYQFHTEFDMGRLDGNNRMNNNYRSNAEIIRNTLIDKGVDTNRVIAVTAEKTMINRTLSSVLAFREWKNEYHGKISGINVISLGTHSRRTWVTYQKIIGRKESVGVIALKENTTWKRKTDKYFIILKDFLEFLYYKFLLIFY